MIQTNGLTKQLGGRTVVSDVTFRCEPGTVTGFLGPNGAGKTTTMRMLVGLSEPDSGHAQVLGGRYRDLSTFASCLEGGHEVWWDVNAFDANGALALLPPFVAVRATVTEVSEVQIP